MTEKLIFHLAEHGSVFSTRSQGRSVLAELLGENGSEAELEIDLAGVRASAYSFLDEFLGGLLDRGFDERSLTLTGAEPQIARIVDAVFERRGATGFSRRDATPAS